MKEQRQWLLLFCLLFSSFFLSEPLFFLIISHITSPLLFFSAKPIHALINFPWTIITAPYNMIMISVFQFITASITFAKDSSDYITLTKKPSMAPYCPPNKQNLQHGSCFSSVLPTGCTTTTLHMLYVPAEFCDLEFLHWALNVACPHLYSGSSLLYHYTLPSSLLLKSHPSLT